MHNRPHVFPDTFFLCCFRDRCGDKIKNKLFSRSSKLEVFPGRFEQILYELNIDPTNSKSFVEDSRLYMSQIKFESKYVLLNMVTFSFICTQMNLS